MRLRREIEAAGGTAPPSRSFAPPPETMSLPSFQSTPGSREPPHPPRASPLRASPLRVAQEGVWTDVLGVCMQVQDKRGWR